MAMATVVMHHSVRSLEHVLTMEIYVCMYLNNLCVWTMVVCSTIYVFDILGDAPQRRLTGHTNSTFYVKLDFSIEGSRVLSGYVYVVAMYTHTHTHTHTHT